MKCKNKIVKVKGLVSSIISMQPKEAVITCTITNDEKGKTLSIDNEVFQFTIPFEAIEEYLK